jgi:hypothetical protein
MPRVVLTTLVATLLVAAPPSVGAQSRTAADSARSALGSRARSAADTLPVQVVERVVAAFNRHDAAAVAAEYDSVYTAELPGDTAGAQRVTRAQLDSAARQDFQKGRPTVRLVRRVVSGPFVADLYTMTEAGRQFPHFSLCEVRGGKIVREIMHQQR